ncbi:hypothetical protein AGMMS49543_27030 [Betaproteobacteria bacterium]|nr:hypothetical protein AGMMS49543_27030 [Betaproteobacteria bacterium]GHU15980.1 hypothetical protein AGMMS50243_01030 [Betaproteobacteria bacterium]
MVPLIVLVHGGKGSGTLSIVGGRISNSDNGASSDAVWNVVNVNGMSGLLSGVYGGLIYGTGNVTNNAVTINDYAYTLASSHSRRIEGGKAYLGNATGNTVGIDNSFLCGHIVGGLTR